MKNKSKVNKDNAPKSQGALKIRTAKKLKAGEALQELVDKKRVLPACESSSACSRPGR